MPNNSQNIQVPSFDSFEDETQVIRTTERHNDAINANTNNSTVKEFSYAYELPLSMVSNPSGAWTIMFGGALFLSAVMFTIILYSLFRVIQIRLAEKEGFEHQPRSSEVELLLGPKNEHGGVSTGGSKTKTRWEQIENHMYSQNSSDWRLAILEADIMLDDVVSSMGYTGEGLGEKLKQIRPEDLNSIEAAWEAHKVRNKIAHEGSAHKLNEREVKRVIGLYKQVFTEMKYI